MTGLRITPLNAAAFSELKVALSAAKLPIADLAEPGRVFFQFGDAALAGFGGLEGEGPDRLLRSLVVPPGRGQGLGRAMLNLIEAQARELGVARLHLLTTTAGKFFAANGYGVADRTSAPAPIASSHESTALCPASATYLVKVL